jgi:hypothetical protein
MFQKPPRRNKFCLGRKELSAPKAKPPLSAWANAGVHATHSGCGNYEGMLRLYVAAAD